MARVIQGTRWCFTLNNYTNEDEEYLSTFLSDDAIIRYGIYGREVGESGTPHLQGFVVYQRTVTWTRAVSDLGGDRVHVERARSNSATNIAYCKKQHSVEEFGDPPVHQGKRTDLEEFFAWGQEFIRENGRPPSSPEVAKQQPICYTKYPRAAKALFHQAPPVEWDQADPRPWQSELRDELLGDPDDRSIIFYIDEDGNNGKTWFCRYMLAHYPDQVQILSGGKRDDVAHVVDPSKNIFLFNVGRKQMKFLQYSVLEGIKDGLLQSNKYVSVMKTFHHKSHVVVFSNEDPDMEALSQDRYVLRNTFN